MTAQLPLRDRLGLAAWRGATNLAGSVARRRTRNLTSITRHAYGSHPAEFVDVFAPASTPERVPIIYIHGGGWICGNVDIYRRRLAEFASVGHRVINVEYPLAPEHPHPKMLQSIVRAIEWFASEHPDERRVHLMGDSAGANLAVMAAIVVGNADVAAALGIAVADQLPEVVSVVSMYGVLDRLTWIEDRFPASSLMLRSYAGHDAFAPSVAPHLAITPLDIEFATLPPTYLAAAGKDRLARSTALAAAQLGARFAAIEYKVYEGAAHGFFTSYRGRGPELTRDIHDFLARTTTSTEGKSND